MSDERRMLTCSKHGTEYAEKEEGVTIGECPWCLQQERDEALSRLGDVLAGCDIERGERLYRQVEVVRGSGKTVDKIEITKLEAKVEELVGENEQLRDWRANVTVALREEGGTFYEDVAEKIKSLRAKVEEMEEREKGLETAIELLLQVLPDTDRFEGQDPSWGDAWNALSVTAQLHVKSVRTVTRAIHDRKKVYFQSSVPGLTADLPNVNGHIYPIEVIQRAVDDFQTKIEERKAIVYVEPEDQGRPQLSEAGGVLTHLWVEDGVVHARGHAIQTLAGAKLTSIIHGKDLGIFSVGKGSIKGKEVQGDFQLNHFSIGSGHLPGGKVEFKLLPEKGEGKKEERDENSD